MSQRTQSMMEQGFNASMAPSENAGEGYGPDTDDTWGDWDDEN